MVIFFKIAGWVIFTFFALGTLGVILSVGQEREPTTPAEAMGVTALNALLLLWICWAILRGA